jgi:hypothetical protein
MPSNNPPSRVHEQHILETEIREAFKGVTRQGGVSWSEAEVIDDYGSEDERAEARAKDTDKDWAELADDEKWDPGPGMGGWSFLDAIGFRYYLPAAMIRALTGGEDTFSVFTMDSILHVTAQDTYRLAQTRLLDEPQRRCIARFVRFMLAREAAQGNDFEVKEWQRVYDDHWKYVEQPRS